MNNFFLVIPTRDRIDFLSNLLLDLNEFCNHISHVVIVDQSIIKNDVHISSLNLKYKYTIFENDRKFSVNHSRNLALRAYKNEEWLFFLDDDLRIPAFAFNQIVQELAPKIIDVLIPGIIRNDLYTKKFEYDSIFETLAKPHDFSKSRFRLQVSSGLNIVNADVFKEAGFYFDENFTIWGDDWDYGLRLLKAGAIIYYQPKILVEHLDTYSGGQRDKSKSMDVKLEKSKLYFYLIHKHFSKTAFKREYYLILLQSLKLFAKGNFRELRTHLKAYNLFKKMI
ncbi:glycosyltransferase family 2 protein [Gelidibacter mesophilus]|uniref:glycosyltransferase family 2 protein n=1 Tax=Gelidibacter mesophilus TaxID=169050 RepID=UPI00042025F6|nr:glycosyltransferase [Gelidibacter mesophilus]